MDDRLHEAVLGDHKDEVRALHGLGVDINGTLSNGRTPVYIAAHEGHSDCVRVLHELGANVNTPQEAGATPVLVAAQEGHTDCIRVLHELGANVNTPEASGATPVYIAASKGHTDCIRVLHELGANLNTPEADGALPSHLPAPAKELIMRMLVVDPMKRLTISEVRQHPWFLQKLPVYMSMLPAEMDMQKYYIDDEIIRAVCQLNIKGVAPELVVEAVQQYVGNSPATLTNGPVGNGKILVAIPGGTGSTGTGVPVGGPAGSSSTPPPPAMGATAGGASSSPAATQRFMHDLRVAYDLLLDAKRHKLRLTDVMNALQEMARISPGSSLSRSPGQFGSAASYLCASPTSQITIKLDMIMRENNSMSGSVGGVFGNNTASAAAIANPPGAPDLIFAPTSTEHTAGTLTQSPSCTAVW